LQEVVGRTLTPSRVMARSPQSLARAGLSRSKVRTIRSLADRFTADPKLARRLPTLSDDETSKHSETSPELAPGPLTSFSSSIWGGRT
jgi:3-methyladenine DNA glycosylase/8-oxoguanine DNA glycosylase